MPQVGAMKSILDLLNQGKFASEIDIHFPGLKNVDKRPVLAYPELLVCFNCGKAEFTIPRVEFALLARSES
jgi:hypothetical protein